MSRILTVTISALMLAACTSEPSYDKSAVPGATTELRQATTVCEQEQTPSKFIASKFMACRVAAERNFAMAIHARKMDAFDIYATKTLALGADYDAGRINLKRMGSRATSIRNDYWRACECGPRGSQGYDLAVGAFVPSSDLTPPGVQLSSQP